MSRVVSEVGSLPALSPRGVDLSVASVLGAEWFLDSCVKTRLLEPDGLGFRFLLLHFWLHHSGLHVTLWDQFLITGSFGETLVPSRQ